MTTKTTRFQLAAALLVACAAAARAAPPLGKQADYFAGVYLLQTSTGLSARDRAAKYRELEALTGISTAQAQTLLKQYREKPAEWKMVYDSIFVRLARPPAAAPAAPKDTAAKPTMHKKRR